MYLWQVGATVDPLVLSVEGGQAHLVLGRDLGGVEVRVEHDHREGQHVGRVRVGERARVGVVKGVGKGLRRHTRGSYFGGSPFFTHGVYITSTRAHTHWEVIRRGGAKRVPSRSG